MPAVVSALNWRDTLPLKPIDTFGRVTAVDVIPSNVVGLADEARTAPAPLQTVTFCIVPSRKSGLSHPRPQGCPAGICPSSVGFGAQGLNVVKFALCQLLILLTPWDATP